MMQLSGVMVRALKGAAASIILLFLAEQRPMSQAAMRRYSGYADEAISDALGLLREMGMVTETRRYTWALLGNIQQLPIGAADALPEAVDVATEALAPDDPDLCPHACMQESLTDSTNEIEHTCLSSSGNSGPENDLNAALDDAGIRDPALSRLKARRGLTARTVRYHVQTAPSLGAAITRIDQNWRVPADFEPVEDDPEEVGRERRHQYAGGQYAAFVKT